MATSAPAATPDEPVVSWSRPAEQNATATAKLSEDVIRDAEEMRRD